MTLTDRLKAETARLQSQTATASPAELTMSAEMKAELLKRPVQRRTEAYITMHEPTKHMLTRANICAFRLYPEYEPAGFKPDCILIAGESGTGKELLAQILLCNEDANKFFPVNCAGLVDNLFESLLFGHVRGSFTGADQSRPGLLVSAANGIAFFDEVGELPLPQQAKLLRVIQERKVLAVGSTNEVPIRCRLVFATNRNLEDMVERGTFREDLYYRISALSLTTYPLRERPDDAILIVDKWCVDRGWDVPDASIPHNVINGRGNIRALENWLLKQQVFGE